MNGVFSAVVLSMTTLAAAPNQPGWLRDYGKALQTTRTAKQPLLVVLHNPEDPQQRVEQVESEPGEAKLLQGYTLCHIDVTTKYGKKVAAAFGAKEFPYTVITNKTGDEIILRRMGRFAPGEWDETLLSYRDGRRRSAETTQFVSANGVDTKRIDAYKPIIDSSSFEAAPPRSAMAPSGYQSAAAFSFPSLGASGPACRT